MPKKNKSKNKKASSSRKKKSFKVQPLKIEKIATQTKDFVTSKHLKASKNIKKLVGAVLVIAVVVVGIIFGKVGDDKPEYATTVVKKDTLIQTVNETGVIQASDRIDLNFLNIGRIAKILVEVGDVVEKDQVLASLDYKNLLIMQKEAEANLLAQKARLEKIVKGATREEINVTKSTLNQAKANYETILLELNETDKTNQENIQQAQTTLDNLDQIGEDKITAHEQAVKVAAVSLANIEDTYSKTLSDYKASAVVSVETNLAVTNTALDNVNTILTNETLKDTFSAKDTAYLINAKRYYDLSLEQKQTASNNFDLISADSNYEFINATLNETANTIQKTFSALENTYGALENTVISLYLTQAQLDALKVTVSAQLTLVGAAKSAIQTITQNLETANLNYINQVNLAEENLAQAKVNLDDALLSAQNNLNIVKLASHKQTTLTQARLNSSREALNVAQAQLAQIKAPARESDIALQQAQIAQAEASLESIINNMEGSVIKAPQNGAVIKVNYDEGEKNMTQPVISMLFDDSLKIEVDISETDIIKVEKGDEVEITLDAFGEDEQFSGLVSFIEPAETLIQDVVYYKVIIKLDATSELAKKIKPGMSANVTIITDKKENVLIIPYRAIVSKNGKGDFIRVLKKDVMREVPLKTGMRGDGGNVQVLSGVKKGDVVVTYIKQ